VDGCGPTWIDLPSWIRGFDSRHRLHIYQRLRRRTSVRPVGRYLPSTYRAARCRSVALRPMVPAHRWLSPT